LNKNPPQTGFITIGVVAVIQSTRLPARGWSHASEGRLETADFQGNANHGGRRVGFSWRDWLVMAGLSMQVIDYMVVLSALPVMRKVLFSKFSHVVFAKWSSNS